MNARLKNVLAAHATTITRPRFSLLQVVAATLLLAVVVVGGHKLDSGRTASSRPALPAASYTLPEPSVVDTGRYAWIVNPMRALCAEWENDDGRYAWLTGPLQENGLTPSDVLSFYERLANAE